MEIWGDLWGFMGDWIGLYFKRGWMIMRPLNAYSSIKKTIEPKLD